MCKLHNEVFKVAEIRMNNECSLTMREGISKKTSFFAVFRTFPHYARGYIDEQMESMPEEEVPSLCARVYRGRRRDILRKTGSLTMREGISKIIFHLLKGGEFPHYARGYIVVFVVIQNQLSVPSLCVRVYRLTGLNRKSAHCSLTMREGISSLRQ